MVQVRLEQRTDEEALQSSEMKKQELTNKKQQLSEQRLEERGHVCTYSHNASPVALPNHVYIVFLMSNKNARQRQTIQ